MNEQKNDNSTNFLQRFIVFVGIAILLSGQILIFSRPVNDTFVFPEYIWLSAIGVFVFIFSQVFHFKSTKKWLPRITISEQTFWILISITLSLTTIFANHTLMSFSRINSTSVITLWFLSAASFVYPFIKNDPDRKPAGNWLSTNKFELLIVLAVIVLGFAVRFYKLGELPRVIDGDEGRVGLTAQLTSSGELANPFALWENFGSIYLQAINFAFKIFGPSAFALRLMPAIGGVLAIPAIYLLARQFGGRQIALIAALLIAISHTHIHFSRIASVAYIQGIWIAPLELYFLISGLVKQKSWRTALGGVILGFHLSIYLTAQIVIGMIIVFMLIMALAKRSWFMSVLRQAGTFWLGFLIVSAPQVYYNIKQTHNFMDRLNQDGMFQSGWLAEQIQITGKGVVEILFERIVHAFLSMIYYPSLDFYGVNSPILSTIASTLFMIGLGIALWRIKDPKYLLLNGYFWAATVSVGVFALPQSADTYRMIIALPAALIMAAIGLNQILEQLNLGWDTAPSAYTVSVTVILTSLLISNYWIYYADFVGLCRFGGERISRFASYLGDYVATVENESNIYLLSNDIYFYGSHGSTEFLSQKRHIENFPEPAEQLDLISGETVIANPDRIEELRTWIRSHPGGKIHYLYDCENLILMSYQLP